MGWVEGAGGACGRQVAAPSAWDQSAHAVLSCVRMITAGVYYLHVALCMQHATAATGECRRHCSRTAAVAAAAAATRRRFPTNSAPAATASITNLALGQFASRARRRCCKASLARAILVLCLLLLIAATPERHVVVGTLWSVFVGVITMNVNAALIVGKKRRSHGQAGAAAPAHCPHFSSRATVPAEQPAASIWFHSCCFAHSLAVFSKGSAARQAKLVAACLCGQT